MSTWLSPLRPANVFAAQARGAPSVALEPRLVPARLVACCGLLGGGITIGREPTLFRQGCDLLASNPDGHHVVYSAPQEVWEDLATVARLLRRSGRVPLHAPRCLESFTSCLTLS